MMLASMLMFFPLLLHFSMNFPLIPWVLARTACVFDSLLLKQGQTLCWRKQPLGEPRGICCMNSALPLTRLLRLSPLR